MKYIFFTFLLSCVAFLATAQFTKGLKQIGVSTSAFESKTNNEYAVGNIPGVGQSTVRQLRILSRLGFFANQNISIGFGFGYSNNFTKINFDVVGGSPYQIEIKNNSFDVNLFSRFHKSISDRFYLFLEPNLSADFGIAKSEVNGDVEESIFKWGIGLTQGLVYLINPKFGIEASFGFIGFEQEIKKLRKPELQPIPKNEDKRLVFDTSLQSFQLGFYYYF